MAKTLDLCGDRFCSKKKMQYDIVDAIHRLQPRIGFIGAQRIDASNPLVASKRESDHG